MTVVAGFELAGRDLCGVGNVAVESRVVESVDVFEGGLLDVIEAPPRARWVDEPRLLEAAEALGHRVVYESPRDRTEATMSFAARRSL